MFLVTPNYFEPGPDIAARPGVQRRRRWKKSCGHLNRALAQHRGQKEPDWPSDLSGDLKAWAIVVGEVSDVHSYSLDRTPVPNLYLPEADGPDTSMTIFLRTASDPTKLDETVHRLLRSNSGLTVRYVESMPELMAMRWQCANSPCGWWPHLD